MKTCGAYEAKTRLSELLKDVERGETVLITRRGVPVAKLVSVASTENESFDELVAEIIEFRGGKTLDGISIRELIEAGRRY